MPDPAPSDLFQPTAYTPEGKAVPQEEMAAAVKEGRASFEKGKRVYAKNEGGTFVTIPAEDAGLPSYQLLTDEQIKQERRKKDARSAGGMAKTALEGLARAPTLGFLGPEQFYDAEGRARALARTQENPGLAAGSELVGMVGLGGLAAFLSGGAAAPAVAEGLGGSLARLGGRAVTAPWLAAETLGGVAQRAAGGLVGEGLAGRALGLAARGVTEGAIGGAGRKVSQAALENTPLTAEQLLSGATEGAVLGGLLTPAFGLAGSAVGRGIKAVRSNKALQAGARKVAAKQAMRAVGIETRDELGDILGEELIANMKAGDTAETILSNVRATRASTQAAVDAVRAQADDVLRAAPKYQPDLRKAVAEVDDLLQPLRNSSAPAERAMVHRIDAQLGPLREVAAGDAVKVRLADGSPAVVPREPLTFSQLEELHAGIKLPKATTAASEPVLEKVKRVIAEPFEKTTSDVLGESASKYSALRSKAERLAMIEELAPAPRSAGMSDALGGIGMGTVLSAMTGNVGGVAMGMAAGVAKKMIEDRGHSVFAKIADSVAESGTRIDAAARVAAMLDSSRGLPGPIAVNVGRLFEKYMRDLDQSDEEVADQMGKLGGDLHHYAPELAAAVTERALADRAYLKSIAPVPTTNANQTLTPKASTKATYSYDQKKTFVDSAVALERPLSVFEDIARGEWPREKIAAIKERRPLMYDQMRTSVVRFTAERDEELPYQRRMLLGVAFEFPSDWSMVNVGTIQQSLATPEKEQTDPRAAPSKVTDEPGKAIEPGGF